MDIDRRFWSKVALPLGLTALLAGPALAQQEAGPQPPKLGTLVPAAQTATPAVDQRVNDPALPDRPSPSGLLDGPSIHETGKVGTAPDAPPPAIPPEDQLGAAHEKSIGRAAAAVDTPPPDRPAGVINPQILQTEIEPRFAALENCRVDVARNKRVAPAKVLANTLTLRWTIRSTGETAETAVIATTPVDLDVMDCVKSAMTRWRFTPGIGGPVRVERTFTFRPLGDGLGAQP